MNQAEAFEQAYARARRGASFRVSGGVGLYALPLLDEAAVVTHGFSARTGGVSEGSFCSLNLSFTRPEERGNVVENYRRLCAAAEIPYESMVADHYEHGTTVLRVVGTDAGRGFWREPLPPCDGLVTDVPGLTLVTGHADCMAFYAVDARTRCIGLAHAGWRGALGRIGRSLIGKLADEYGADPADIRVGVGPSICPNCFEVGRDVAALFEQAFPGVPLLSPGRPGKGYVDLWKAAFCQFTEAGVLPEHIAVAGVCTVEDGRLFSYRRDGRTGGMAAYLRLK